MSDLLSKRPGEISCVLSPDQKASRPLPTPPPGKPGQELGRLGRGLVAPSAFARIALQARLEQRKWPNHRPCPAPLPVRLLSPLLALRLPLTDAASGT